MSQAWSPGRCCCPLSHYSLRRSVGGAHTDSSKSGFQPTFGPAAPTHSFPLGAGQHVFGRDRENIWHVALTWPTPNFGNRPNELNVNWIHLEVTGDANGPGKPACREPLWKRRAEAGALRPYPASASTQPKRTPAPITRSISARAISGLERGVRYSTGTPARFKRAVSLVQFSGRKRRKATGVGFWAARSLGFERPSYPILRSAYPQASDALLAARMWSG
jgi:hypothetical protein